MSSASQKASPYPARYQVTGGTDKQQLPHGGQPVLDAEKVPYLSFIKHRKSRPQLRLSVSDRAHSQADEFSARESAAI
jgi:hypothetical protein